MGVGVGVYRCGCIWVWVCMGVCGCMWVWVCMGLNGDVAKCIKMFCTTITDFN